MLDSLIASRMAVVYMQLFLILNLKASLKRNIGKSIKIKKKYKKIKGSLLSSVLTRRIPYQEH